MNVRCEENLWAFNFLLWTRTRIVKSSRGQKWDTLKKKQHSPSYSRDNGFNLLCMKRDIGRENPERAECFTGQGRDTVNCPRPIYGSLWGFTAVILPSYTTVFYLNHGASAHALLCCLGRVRRWRTILKPSRSQDFCLHPNVPEKGRCLVSVGLSFWLEMKLCSGLAADPNWIACLPICQKCQE